MKMTKNSNAADLYLAIKARVVDDLETMEEKIFNFSQTIGHSAYQEDIYFQVGTGQLKLRLTSKVGIKQCIFNL
jgi:adenylate cyclase class IV